MTVKHHALVNLCAPRQMHESQGCVAFVTILGVRLLGQHDVAPCACITLRPHSRWRRRWTDIYVQGAGRPWPRGLHCIIISTYAPCTMFDEHCIVGSLCTEPDLQKTSEPKWLQRFDGRPTNITCSKKDVCICACVCSTPDIDQYRSCVYASTIQN